MAMTIFLILAALVGLLASALSCLTRLAATIEKQSRQIEALQAQTTKIKVTMDTMRGDIEAITARREESEPEIFGTVEERMQRWRERLEDFDSLN